MRSYETARTLFGFLEFIAKLTVVIGVLAALAGAGGVSKYGGGGAAFLATMPGLAISFVGLFMMAFIQNARATVDTAEYTQQMLKISRAQLDVSEQSLKQGDTFQKNYASLNMETQDAPGDEEYSEETSKLQKIEQQNPEPSKQIEQETQYEGRIIKEEGGAYKLGKLCFSSLASAQTYIDRLGVNPKVESRKPSHKP